MKLYVLDENGRVVFEFSGKSGGPLLGKSAEQKAKIIVLLKAAQQFLHHGKLAQ